MLHLFSFFLLIATTVIASPTPADNPPAPDASILTSFKFAGCSDGQTQILNQNVKDAVTIASAGLHYINDEARQHLPAIWAPTSRFFQASCDRLLRPGVAKSAISAIHFR